MQSLHIIANLIQCSPELCQQDQSCKSMIDSLIKDLGLEKVGELWHKFTNEAFTCCIGLTESHISIHTWPENSRVCFDVFISNFNQNNSEKVRIISKKLEDFFDGVIELKQEIWR